MRVPRPSRGSRADGGRGPRSTSRPGAGPGEGSRASETRPAGRRPVRRPAPSKQDAAGQPAATAASPAADQLHRPRHRPGRGAADPDHLVRDLAADLLRPGARDRRDPGRDRPAAAADRRPAEPSWRAGRTPTTCGPRPASGSAGWCPARPATGSWAQTASRWAGVLRSPPRTSRTGPPPDGLVVEAVGLGRGGGQARAAQAEGQGAEADHRRRRSRTTRLRLRPDAVRATPR